MVETVLLLLLGPGVLAVPGSNLRLVHACSMHLAPVQSPETPTIPMLRGEVPEY